MLSFRFVQAATAVKTMIKRMILFIYSAAKVAKKNNPRKFFVYEMPNQSDPVGCIYSTGYHLRNIL